MLNLASLVDGLFQYISVRSAVNSRLPEWIFSKEVSLYTLGKTRNFTGVDDPWHQFQGMYLLILCLSCFCFSWGDQSPTLLMWLVYYWGFRENMIHVFLPVPGKRQIPIFRFTKKLREKTW